MLGFKKKKLEVDPLKAQKEKLAARLAIYQRLIDEAAVLENEPDTEENQRALLEIKSKVPMAQLDVDLAKKALADAEIKFAAAVEQAAIDKENQKFIEVETKIEPEFLRLGDEIANLLDQACHRYWRLIDLVGEIAKIGPKMDANLEDSPAGTHFIEKYFRQHLRKHQLMWSFPHFEQQTDTIPTISEGCVDAMRYVQKLSPKNLQKMAEAKLERERARKDMSAEVVPSVETVPEVTMSESGQVYRSQPIPTPEIDITKRPKKPRISLEVPT